MFSNIGGKIKIVAQIVGYGGMAVSFLGCFGNLLSGIEYYYLDSSAVTLPLLGLVVYPILFWLASLIMYGFGQLVENSDTLIELISDDEDSED